MIEVQVVEHRHIGAIDKGLTHNEALDCAHGVLRSPDVGVGTREPGSGSLEEEVVGQILPGSVGIATIGAVRYCSTMSFACNMRKSSPFRRIRAG